MPSIPDRDAIDSRTVSANEDESIAMAIDRCRTALKTAPDDARARRDLARLLVEAGKAAAAAEQWSILAYYRPDMKEPWLQLTRYHLQRRDPDRATACVEKLLALDPTNVLGLRETARVRTLRVALDAAADAGELHHVAIAGVSYCGSTLLAHLLGSLRGVENVGESHWLTQRRKAGANVDVDFARDDYEKQVHCFSCGSACRVFTKAFRASLAADPANWYHKIAYRLGCRTLVSSEKNYAKLIDKDPLLRMDAVILFKSPVQAWYSNYKKHASKTMSPARDLDKYLDAWTASYSRLLREFDNQGDKVVLDFEAFCGAPAPHFQRLCACLGLRHDPAVLAHIAPGQHCFGGNVSVNRGLRNAPDTFAVRPLPPVELPDEHLQRIAAHAPSRRVHEALQARYRADFGMIPPALADSIGRLLDWVGEHQPISEEKRRVFVQAACDQERELRIRLHRLEGSPRATAGEIRCLRQALATIDFDRLREWQTRYLSEARNHREFVKYLNLDYWLAAKLRIARWLGLDETASQRILDLGTGPGHFAFVCKTLGHQVNTTDVELRAPRGQSLPHLYDALVQLFGLERLIHRIEAFEPLPAFPHRFDLVSAQMVKFNVPSAASTRDSLWDTGCWRFFLRDVGENLLADAGRLYLKLNRTGRNTRQCFMDDEVQALLRGLSEPAETDDSVYLFTSAERLRRL